MQVRLAQSLSISEFPVGRGDNETCIANLPKRPMIVCDRAFLFLLFVEASVR
jgi:hypothetical protein